MGRAFPEPLLARLTASILRLDLSWPVAEEGAGEAGTEAKERAAEAEAASEVRREEGLAAGKATGGGEVVPRTNRRPRCSSRSYVIC
jgi:hypothetical protein